MTFLASVKQLPATYPALSAALVNIAVIVAAYFGLPLTGAELVYLVGVVTTLFGVIVHSNVVPLIKANAPTAVLAPQVFTPKVSVLPVTTVESDPVV